MEQWVSIGKLELGNMNNNMAPGNSPDAEDAQEQSNHWAQLVESIRAGDANAIQDVDDKVHDTFLIVVQAIKNGDLREPDRIMGFVRTVARRLVAGHIDHVVH